MGLQRQVLYRLATGGAVERALTTVPGGTALAWLAASRYLAGRTRAEGRAAAADLVAAGHGVSLDLVGEQEADPLRADRVVDGYLDLLGDVGGLGDLPGDGRVWLSVDLSHLALDTDPAGAADRLAALAAALPPTRRVQVGSEDAGRAGAVLDCVLAVAGRGLADRLGATVPANLDRSPADADALVAAGVQVRLVKGAYPGTFAYGEPTDVAFLRLGARLAAAGADWSMATHDGRLREALLLATAGSRAAAVEQLLGVRPEVLAELRSRGVPTRVYVPYGPEWLRYWLRRLAEARGA